MGQIVLVTGGGRSGKSAYAQKMAESLPGSRAFIATCPAIDDEIRERIRKHQDARRERGWKTIEELLDIQSAICNTHDFAILVVDCLTLWINNLHYEAEKSGNKISESEISLECRKLVAACGKHPGTIIFVTNEVGMGIIPENALSRLYRDLVGRCNQIIAEASDRVVLLISGQPIEIKKETAP
jgi:adenosylcobinamide kinase/adenosylcobinamide-phosphate guanylyltransferase